MHQSQLGDMRSYFKIPDESQLALNEAKQAIDLISHDWHGIDPNTAVTLKISFPQSGSINWSTGQVRPGKTAIEMVDGPETWIPMLLGGIELKLGARLGAEILEEGAAKAGANLLKPLAMGSTGRTVARNLTEQLAMKEIMSNPAMGRVIKTGLKDARWKGWSKMAWNNGGVEIHYVAKFENGVLKAVDDFKFIGGQ